MRLLELAERCEAAAGPGRDLDALIVVALNQRPTWCSEGGELWIDEHSGIGQPVIRLNKLGRRSSGNPPIGDYPWFTVSLDAALTLLPEGWVWRHEPTKHVPHLVSVAPVYSQGGYAGHSDRSAALAICAAALRAIAAAARQSGDVQQAPGEAPQSGHEVASPKGGSHA